MLKQINAAVRVEPEKIDDMGELFTLLSKKKNSVKPYSLRYKQVIKFHSAHKLHNGDTLECIITGPDTEEIRFKISQDKHGYLFKMSVGQLNEETLKTMNHALKGVLKKLKQPSPDGFTTKHLDGIYLWGTDPDEQALSIYQESVALGQMSSEFRDLCIEWNISIRKFPEA